MNEELKRELTQLFSDNFDCYYNVDPTGGEPAMAREKFIEIVSKKIESKLPKEVEIKEGNVEHTEPLDTEWHKCPNCDNIVIATADRFCSSCGSKIKWVAK